MLLDNLVCAYLNLAEDPCILVCYSWTVESRCNMTKRCLRRCTQIARQLRLNRHVSAEVGLRWSGTTVGVRESGLQEGWCSAWQLSDTIDVATEMAATNLTGGSPLVAQFLLIAVWY